MKHPARGFTLMEVLVVLMITSMVSVILFQGLGSILAIRNSAGAKVLDLSNLILQRNIILDPIRGIIPDHARGKHIFDGNAHEMHGLTIRPLGEATGAPRPFDLSFEYDGTNDVTNLVYRGERDDPPQLVAAWRGHAGRFVYRGLSGGWKESWAVQAGSRDPQTPWLVGIETGLEANAIVIAYLESPHERRLRLQDIGFGSAEQ